MGLGVTETYQALLSEEEQWEHLAAKESDLALRLLRATVHDPTFMREMITVGVTPDDFLAPALRAFWKCAVPIFETTGKVETLLLTSELERLLAAGFPVGDTTCGVGWVRAFYAAVVYLGATVVVEPVPEDEPSGVIH